MPRSKSAWVGISLVLLLGAAGCSPKKPDNTTIKNVIDSHFNEHPECLWVNPVQLPATLHTDNSLKAPTGHTLRYDVLTDAGLLTRTEQKADRKVPHSEPMDIYDLSQQGRAAWTADPSQPGYGNFCYGRREVSSIEQTTTRKQGPTFTASVSYQYNLVGVPDWAKSPQVDAAFPNVETALAGPKTAQADLVKTGNEWEFKQGN